MMNKYQDSSAPEPGDVQQLLSALVDGELSERERAEVAERLAHDPEGAARVAQYRLQNAALRALFPLPAETPSLFIQRQAPWWRVGLVGGLCLTLGLGLGVAIGYGALDMGSEQAAYAKNADVAYAVYAPEQRHPVEVAGSEQAHLQAWLSKRLHKPLLAPSLSEYGYALIGGRLLPGDTGPAAQFMYQNSAGDRLTLYVTAFHAGEKSLRWLRVGSRRTIYWANQGLGYAFSGLGDETKLREMASDVCNALGGRVVWKG